MPRPGPRPYECVRRAWHSDRHQPIRGSIIQQIFRVVTEAHSSNTRKNREWQEKLPRVVLKAEEIMYSKANSEAEYVDPDTLWDRLNDAVDTIIRRDESTETSGQFLQPCIEAALVLGCVPVRASRSQRHSNPRTYLNPRYQEPAQGAPALPEKNSNHRPHSQPFTPSTNQVIVPRSSTANQASSAPVNSSQLTPTTSFPPSHGGSPRPVPAIHTSPHLQHNFRMPMSSMAVERNIPIDFNKSVNFSTLYPSYCGSHFQNLESQFGFRPPQSSNNIIIGTPVGWSAAQTAQYATRNLLPGDSTAVETEQISQVKPVEGHGKAVERDCDLSLRLGPSEPSSGSARRITHVTEGVGFSSQQESNKFAEPYVRNREFSFFPRHMADDPSESCNRRLEQEGELEDKIAASRKRKDPAGGELNHGSTQWFPELEANRFDGQNRWPGL